MSHRRILFAHGAGAPSTSAWMRSWAARLGALGAVASFDYPYMAAGKKRPDPLPTLIGAHREAAAALAGGSDAPLVYMGKSMGSRVGCHLALEQRPAALVCFGYPLRAPSGKLRDEVLLRLRAPILFVQGTRDPLCPLDTLAAVRAKMTAPSSLTVIEAGDHSLLATKTWCKKSGKSQDDVDAGILTAIAAFLAAHGA